MVTSLVKDLFCNKHQEERHMNRLSNKFFVLSTILALSHCGLFEPNTGVTDSYTFFSSSIRTLSSVIVYTPDPYDSDTPVIYLLNGWGADANAWGSGMDLAHEAQERKIVFVSLTAGANTYTNDPLQQDENYEDYVLEVVSKTEQEYDIDIGYEQRALCGISNGGGGALFILSEHPDSFIACGSLSGTRYSSLSNYANLVDRGIRIDVGTTDGVLNQLRWLRDKLDEENVEHEYYEHAGKHDWDFWGKYAPKQFDFLETFIKD